MVLSIYYDSKRGAIFFLRVDALPYIFHVCGYGSNDPETSSCASVSSNSTSDIATASTTTVAESETPGPREALPTNQPSCDDSDRITNIGMTQRRTTTGLVDMEHSLGISADDIHGSTTGRQSRVDQETPYAAYNIRITAQPSLWPAEVLYELDFYTDVWYTDIIASILILVYACGAFTVWYTSGDSGIQSTLNLIRPQHWLIPLCIFCSYFFLYVIICVRSKLYPDVVCFQTTIASRLVCFTLCFFIIITL